MTAAENRRRVHALMIEEATSLFHPTPLTSVPATDALYAEAMANQLPGTSGRRAAMRYPTTRAVKLA